MYMLMLIECSLTVYPLNDVNPETTVSHDVDAVVCLPRTKQDGARRHKLSLHVFAQLHKQRLLEMTKGSASRERERERERGQLLLISTNKHFLPNRLTQCRAAKWAHGTVLHCKPRYHISLL